MVRVTFRSKVYQIIRELINSVYRWLNNRRLRLQVKRIHKLMITSFGKILINLFRKKMHWIIYQIREVKLGVDLTKRSLVLIQAIKLQGMEINCCLKYKLQCLISIEILILLSYKKALMIVFLLIIIQIKGNHPIKDL